MRDRDLQALVDRETKLREKDAARAAVAPRRSKPTRPAELALSDIRRTVPGGIGVLGWTGAVIAAIAISPLRTEPIALAVTSGYLAVFMLRLVVRGVSLRRTMAELRAFPAGMPFEVTGWRELIASLVGDPERWRLECVVEIDPGDAADVAVVHALGDSFARRANDYFYYAESVAGASGDPRKRWTREGCTLTGSANVWVACEIVQLARKIKRVASRIGEVRSLAIAVGGSVVGCSRARAVD